jgi:hypothetical protein
MIIVVGGQVVVEEVAELEDAKVLEAVLASVETDGMDLGRYAPGLAWSWRFRLSFAVALASVGGELARCIYTPLTTRLVKLKITVNPART